MADYMQVTTTTETREQAGQIARGVVERRLAACAQIIGPITSTYWWKGRVETSDEWMVVMKTRAALLPQLQEAIRSLHTYEVPEIVAVPIAAGNPAYLQWLTEETSAGLS
ncbi:MAG: divalent-cation tolerance protein CutA [Candidatus Sumerlaeia bacterium]|nr:divalent-cation tolerance protein CutA [Candidatus Sumerlaeia bacterium]